MARKFHLQSFQVHSRSISLPARLHPNSFELELNDIPKIPKQSFTVESIQTNLTRLVKLYNSTGDVLISVPVRDVEETLKRWISLLDACENAREMISNMKDEVQYLQLALRRRIIGGDYSTMERKIHAYMTFRKKSNKKVVKYLKELKRIDSNIESSSSSTMDMDILLRETITSFQSILGFCSMKTRANGWSLIRKLLNPTHEEMVLNEVGSVDVGLYHLQQQMQRNSCESNDVKESLGKLENLEVCLRMIESSLDCLFRGLIQHRVSLLNILTPLL